jgi:twitching motility protein PilT
MDDHNEVDIITLLRTVVDRGASDLHIACGHPPVLRIGGQMVPLQARTLEAEDCLAIMQCLTPERNQQELQEKGDTAFGFAFGDQARFRIAVFKRRGNIGMVLRRIRTDEFPA